MPRRHPARTRLSGVHHYNNGPTSRGCRAQSKLYKGIKVDFNRLADVFDQVEAERKTKPRSFLK
jgi:hypothetical protein